MRDFEKFFNHLLNYIYQYGDAFVPFRYTAEDGYKLGYYVIKVRSGYVKTTEKEKQKLTDAGFEWQGKKYGMKNDTFEKYFHAFKEFYNEHGHCNIPQSYVDKDGKKIGVMATHIRVIQECLNPNQVSRLNELHFIWNYKNKRVPFEEFCRLLEEYRKEKGSCYIPVGYVTQSGVLFGEIARNFRSGTRKVTEEQRKILDSLGFVWKLREYKKIITESK